MRRFFVTALAVAVLLALTGTVLADSGTVVESEARLDGSQEAPQVATAMTGEVEVEIEDGLLEFELLVNDNSNDIFAAHIHCGLPGANGPVGITLFFGSFTATSGIVAAGTITAPDSGNRCGWADLADVAAAIHNGNTYVNVHTTAASGGTPSGEIRGNPAGERRRKQRRWGPQRRRPERRLDQDAHCTRQAHRSTVPYWALGENNGIHEMNPCRLQGFISIENQGI